MTPYSAADQPPPAVGCSLAEFFPLAEVPKHLPRRPSGKQLHPKVPIRWALQGSWGVRLRFIAAGRQKLTCSAWLMEFTVAVAEAQQRKAGGGDTATPAQSRHARAAVTPDSGRREKTKRALAAAGFGR